jgi:hypothetical protein
MRPDVGPDSLWRDDPTTIGEENGRPGRIPTNIFGLMYAVPFLPKEFTIRESEMDNMVVRIVKLRCFKQEFIDEAFKKVPEDDDDDTLSMEFIDTEDAKESYSSDVEEEEENPRQPSKAVKKLHFDPLPLTAAFEKVPTDDDDDDDTLSMDTEDQESEDHHGWEMRK